MSNTENSNIIDRLYFISIDDSLSFTISQLFPRTYPIDIQAKFQIAQLKSANNAEAIGCSLEIPPANAITERIPGKNLFNAMIKYPYLLNHLSAFLILSALKNGKLFSIKKFLPKYLPR